MYAGSALIGVLAAAVAIPVFAFGQGGGAGGVRVEGNAVAIIDPHSNEVVGQVPVGASPQAIAAGSGSLWVANLDDQTVSRVDLATRKVTRTLAVGDTPTGVASSNDAVWVVGSVPTQPFVAVRKIDPRFNTVSDPTNIGNVGPGDVGVGRGRWPASLGRAVFGPAHSPEPEYCAQGAAGRSQCRADRDRGGTRGGLVDGQLRRHRDAGRPDRPAHADRVGHGPSGIAVGAGRRLGRRHARRCGRSDRPRDADA